MRACQKGTKRACQKKHHESLPKKSITKARPKKHNESLPKLPKSLSVRASQGFWEQTKLPSSGSCWFFMALVVFEPGSQNLALCKGLHQCICAYSESRSAEDCASTAELQCFEDFKFSNFTTFLSNGKMQLENLNDSRSLQFPTPKRVFSTSTSTFVDSIRTFGGQMITIDG